MKRTALFLGIPYIAGLLLASQTESGLMLTVLGLVCSAALFVVFLRKSVWKYVLISTLSLLMACCVYWGYERLQVAPQLTYAGVSDTVFSGTITAISEHASGYATYTLDGSLNGETDARMLYTCQNAGYAYGDTLTLSGTPQQMVSGYLFDTTAYYRANGVFLRMFYPDQVEHTARAGDTLRSVLYEWREAMTSRILKLTDSQSGAALVGMLFGDKSALDGSSKTALYRVGIGHVLAVSGLHLDFIALCVAGLLHRCGADRRLSFAVLAILAVLFVICVGETVSVKRACIMILISQSAGLFFRRADVLNSLSIAMFLLGLENPFVIHSAAFWLSAAGTFGIGVFAPYMTEKLPEKTMLQKLLRQAVGMFCVFIAVFPLTVLYFREASLISPLSNMLLVPFCMLSFALSALSLVFGAQGLIGELLITIAEYMMQGVLLVSEELASLPFTYIGTDSEILLAAVCIAVVSAALCYFLCRSRRMLCGVVAGTVFMTIAAVSFDNSNQSEQIRLSLLGDERDCVLVVSYGTEAVVVDFSGDSHAPSYVQAYLESSSMRSVEALFLCDTSEVRMADYDAALYYYPPDKIIHTDTEEALDGYYRMEFHDAQIVVYSDTAEISYGSMTFLCCREAQAVGACEILAVYGTCRDTLPDCGILMVLDERSCYRDDSSTYVGENNLELTLAADGRCRVRRLYAGT